MSRRRTFSVVPTGVGRKDWSQNVEQTVEPQIRSHMYRYNWAIETTYEASDFPGEWDFPHSRIVLLRFEDRAGNLLNYVPYDMKYLMYNAVVSGDFNSLTLGALYSTRGLVELETIFEIFGYGKVPIALARGHVFEAGRSYWISLQQWSEKDEYTASFIVHAYTDEMVG